ncbi:pyridoxal kinase [Platysternon megacephalum]|uniref:Pyridoxal kinase n=1 Tax=Platysternon megacephalum TaxID=55544 RepID=A0A4D9ED76_9SAUR|nr:pyridoxal kinase [Platysternon megacephalum]
MTVNWRGLKRSRGGWGSLRRPYCLERRGGSSEPLHTQPWAAPLPLQSPWKEKWGWKPRLVTRLVTRTEGGSRSTVILTPNTWSPCQGQPASSIIESAASSTLLFLLAAYPRGPEAYVAEEIVPLLQAATP